MQRSTQNSLSSIFSLFSIVFFSCQPHETKIRPTVEDISESVYASGIVKSENQYQVFSTVSGIIKEIFVAEGERVAKGTPLLKIFNRTSVLNARNAQLAADYARLSENQQRLDELKMGVEVAKIKKANDSLLLERKRQLWAQNIGTAVELEQTILNYQNSVSNYGSAQIQYEDLRRQLELNAKQTLNNLEITSTQADEYIIKSEVDGKVYNILKEKGELVTLQNQLALIGSENQFFLELQVDEYDIARIKEDQQVLINMDSYKGQVFKGVITRISPVMNERSKSFTVEADFTTQPPLLYPFLTVEANIVIQIKKNALTIPRNYLVDESFVWTAGKKKKKVTTGLKDYQKVEILDGLTSDDFILIPEQ